MKTEKKKKLLKKKFWVGSPVCLIRELFMFSGTSVLLTLFLHDVLHTTHLHLICLNLLCEYQVGKSIFFNIYTCKCTIVEGGGKIWGAECDFIDEE